MAKIGGLDAFSDLQPAPVRRSSPRRTARTPPASSALQGVLAALYEREDSGRRSARRHRPSCRACSPTTPGTGSSACSRSATPARSPPRPLPTGTRWSRTTRCSSASWWGCRRTGAGCSSPRRASGCGRRSPRSPARRRCSPTPSTRTRPNSEDPTDASGVLGACPPDMRNEDLRRVARGLRRAARRVGRALPPRHRAAPPPAARARPRTVAIDDPELGAVLQPGPLVRMDATPAPARSTGACRSTSTATRCRTRRPPDPHASAAPPADARLHARRSRASPCSSSAPTTPRRTARRSSPTSARASSRSSSSTATRSGTSSRSPKWARSRSCRARRASPSTSPSDEGREIVYELVRGADAVLQSFRGRRRRTPRLHRHGSARGQPRPRVPRRRPATASTARAATAPLSRPPWVPGAGSRTATWAGVATSRSAPTSTSRR